MFFIFQKWRFFGGYFSEGGPLGGGGTRRWRRFSRRDDQKIEKLLFTSIVI